LRGFPLSASRFSDFAFLPPPIFPRTLRAVPVETGKDNFFAELKALIARAKRLQTSGFDEQEPEAATCHELILPLLALLGFRNENIKPEFKILGDSVDFLLKSDRPLVFVEAKSLLDKAENLFVAHQEQVLRYIRNYRVSPEQVDMEKPVTWIVLANFAQWHFIRVNEDAPTFHFTLADLWPRREELWDLLALENLETGRIEELYEQRHKAGLDQRFLADLKRWRLMLANGFALRNQKRSLDDITHASQQLLNRFLFSRMLETNQLIEWNKLARAYSHYEVFHGDFTEKTFAESLRESLFQEIKFKFNTELFKQPLLCDTLALDNQILAILVGHEPLSPDVAATCGFESGQGELLAFRHLYSYDFSLMSSDVMGAVYEKFLAHRLTQNAGRIVIEDTDELRKKEGIYYTPRYIVDYIVAHTLGEKIKPVLAEAKSLLGCKNFKAAYEKICELSQIKVLDPAMGSGSFLLGAFDALAAAYNDYNDECEKQKRNGGNGDGNGDALFDAPAAKPRPVERLGTAIVSHNLFGVDLDAQAVEVAKLNLWIRLMAAEKDSLRMKLHDPNKGKKPQNLLPALAANFKRGNSLIADKAVAGDAAFDWQKEFPEIMGGTGNLPVPVGDPPTGMGSAPATIQRDDAGAAFTSVSSGGSPDGAGGSPAPPKNRGFDVVIGNPPYERIQVMQANAPEAAEFLKANYRAAASGNFDIYVCFIERGLELLNANGFFGYICPHKFFQAEYGEPVRKLLSEGKHVRQIVSFGDQQVFTQASTYTCLLFLEKAAQERGHFIKVDDLDEWRATGAAASGKISPATFAGDQWNFVLGNGAELFAKLNENAIRLRDVAERIAQGIRTSANPIYVLDVVSMNDSTVTAFSEQLQREVKLERKAIAPFLQGQDIRHYVLETCSKVVILPYQIKAGRAELIAETQLKKKFPLVYDYLLQNKKLLEEREEGRFSGDGWYAYGRLQNVDLMMLPKILVPDIANFASFAFDDAGEFAFASGYGITLKEDAKESPAYLLGLLNSNLLDFYLKQVSTTMRGGYFRYFTQFIEQLPIRRIDPKNKREAKLEKEIVECVEAIQAAHKQRLNLPGALHRKIAHSQNRTPCNLAHYLQKDFAGAVKSEILIDDVQRTGFVHEIRLHSDLECGDTSPLSPDTTCRVVPKRGHARALQSGALPEITFIATVSDTLADKPRPLPVLRLTFKDESLHQFIYASWRQFLNENSRKQKWTKGKKPEPIYPLLVNLLEPLVYFNASAGDNLRAIRDLMKAVAAEAGSADLAAIEAEIQKLDTEIDQHVYELYGLTEAEIKIVESSAK
jgi:type I restriction-modification system DNA methylase subunit